MTTVIRPMLAVLAFATLIPAAADAAVIFDGTFAPADWTTTDVSTGTVATSTVQSPTDGNPDFSRQIAWNSDPWTGSLSVVTLNIYNGFVYDPSVSGAIDALTISFDVRNLRISGGNGGLYYRALLEQGGMYYGTSPSPFLPATALASFSWNASLASDWDLAGAATGMPDFSASGAPIRFGYRPGTLYTCPANVVCAPLEGVDAVDNFRLSVSAVPEPASLVLFGAALVGVVARRARLS